MNLQITASRRLYTPREFTPRTRWRFERDRTAELTRHLGRPASYPEKTIICRILAIEWEQRGLDVKIDQGDELNGHQLRARLAAENRLRLDFVALGLKRREPRSLSLEEIRALATHRRVRDGPLAA